MQQQHDFAQQSQCSEKPCVCYVEATAVEVEPPLWSFIAALPARSGQLQVHPPAGTFGNACCSSAYSALSAPC